MSPVNQEGKNEYTYKNILSFSRCLSDIHEHRRTTRVTSFAPHKYRARNELVVVWLRSVCFVPAGIANRSRYASTIFSTSTPLAITINHAHSLSI
jgi:hypothetical protein